VFFAFQRVWFVSRHSEVISLVSNLFLFSSLFPEPYHSFPMLLSLFCSVLVCSLSLMHAFGSCLTAGNLWCVVPPLYCSCHRDQMNLSFWELDPASFGSVQQTDIQTSLLPCQNLSLSFTKIQGTGQKTAGQLDWGTGQHVHLIIHNNK